MANEFNISQLFEKSFGYALPQEINIPPAGERRTESSLGSSYYGLDADGREFFLPLTFSGVYENNEKFDFVVPFGVASLSVKKTIVSTPLVERKGTVKEIVSTDDYVIDIKGIVLRDDHSFPHDELMEIEKIFKVDASITLRSVLTDIFLKGDYNHRVVIRNLVIPDKQGVEHARAFQMQCESDAIFSLIVE